MVKVRLAKALAGLMSKGLSYSKKELISSLRQSCQRHLEYVFNTFFELSSNTLLGLAEKADTNRLQTLYLDAQRLIRTRRSGIAVQVIEQTRDSFNLLDTPLVSVALENGSDFPVGTQHANDSASHNTPYNHLELLGNEDLEVMIALDNGTTKSLETYKRPLYMLQRRFEALMGSEFSGSDPIPMSPDALLETFAESICDGMVAVEIQVVLINLFNQTCFNRDYGLLLEGVNRELEDAGVLPLSHDDDEPVRVPVPRAREAVVEGVSLLRGSLLGDADGGSLFSSAEGGSLFSSAEGSLLRDAEGFLSQAAEGSSSRDAGGSLSQAAEGSSLQAAEGSDSAPTTRIQTEFLARISTILDNAGREPGNAGGTFVTKGQVFAQIDGLMDKLLSSKVAANGSPGQVTFDLAQSLNTAQKDGQQGLHGNDASVFKLVGNTFSRFGEVSGMAPEAQQVITRCELPLLKLALEKPTLLEQENHPIRRLFNEMAKYAIGLEQGDCAENAIYKQMLGLSETMLRDGFDEQQVPKMLTEFMSAIDTESRLTRLQEQRQLEEVAAKEKIDWAHTRVDQEMADRLLGHEVPVAILNFVEQHWCNVLHIAHLRGGESSVDWHDGLRVLEALLAIEKTELAQRDKQTVAQVLDDIDYRLQHIAIDAVQRAEQMERLTFILDPVLPSNVTPLNTQGTTGTQDKGDKIKRIVISTLQSEMPGKNILQAVDRVETLNLQDQQSLAQLQKGCWIELSDDIQSHKHNDNGSNATASNRRGKLAGIVGPSWKYVFVNNKGKLVAELNRARLAEQLKVGEVKLLDNSHLFDKAIRAAINDIKELSIAG